MWKRLAVLAAAVMLLTAACGNDDDESGATDTTQQSGNIAQTYNLKVDNRTDQFNGAFLAYFPNELTVHPGDTLDFGSIFSGEPHSVTFGTLVDTGLAAAEAAGPDAQEEPADLAKIPLMIPEGPGDANQTAAQPCFLASGDPPPEGPCAKVPQPDFDGRHALYSSGFLAEGDHFTFDLAGDLAPGTYRWFCDLHRAGMTGTLKVVAAGETADTPAAVTKRGEDQLAGMVSALAPVAAQMQAISDPAKAQAGGALPDSPGLVDEFGPKEISIPVGGSVTWDVQGPHTITFNVPEDARTIISKAPDGSVHLNPKSFGPAGGPGMPEGPPSEGPVAIDAGAWNGTGFHNSGLLPGFGPPGSLGYKLKFTKAGTYQYACLVHPDREGTVKVG